MSKRRRVALWGTILFLPLLAFVALVQVTSIPHDIGPSFGALGIPIEICGLAGATLLFVAWITPSGRDPFHPKLAA